MIRADVWPGSMTTAWFSIVLKSMPAIALMPSVRYLASTLPSEPYSRKTCR